MQKISLMIVFLSAVLASGFSAKADEKKMTCVKDQKTVEVHGATEQEKNADCKKKGGVWQADHKVEQKSGGGGGW
jgi:hypothetical protein